MEPKAHEGADNGAESSFEQAEAMRQVGDESEFVHDKERARYMAEAENLYRKEHPLPENATSEERANYLRGIDVLVTEEGLIHKHSKEGLQKVDPVVREKVSSDVFPEGEQERRNLERRIDTDALTGVASVEALNRALPAAEVDPDMAVAVFDANYFGQINKLAGNDAGDAGIIVVADAIWRAAEARGYGERVFRRGGDEFVVLAPSGVIEGIVADACRILDERLAEDRPLPSLRPGVDSARQAKFFPTALFREQKVSLSGSVGSNFESADEKLQTVKRERKAQDAEHEQKSA